MDRVAAAPRPLGRDFDRSSSERRVVRHSTQIGLQSHEDVDVEACPPTPSCTRSRGRGVLGCPRPSDLIACRNRGESMPRSSSLPARRRPTAKLVSLAPTAKACRIRLRRERQQESPSTGTYASRSMARSIRSARDPPAGDHHAAVAVADEHGLEIRKGLELPEYISDVVVEVRPLATDLVVVAPAESVSVAKLSDGLVDPPARAAARTDSYGPAAAPALPATK